MHAANPLRILGRKILRRKPCLQTLRSGGLKSRGLAGGQLRHAAMVSLWGLGGWVFTTGCAPTPPQMPQMPPAPVTVALPLVQTVTDYEETTGRIEPVEAVDIRARVSGYLARVTFQSVAEANQTAVATNGSRLREGDTVEAGTLLFEIDPRPYVAARDSAQAEVDRATAMLQRTVADLARAETLRVNNNISREEYDRIVASRAEAAALVEAARAQLAAAELNVEFTQIKAPITGRLGRALVTIGNLVTADITPLTTLVREDPVHVYFDMPEQVVLHYMKIIREEKLESARARDVEVDVGLANEEGFPHRGVIDFIDNRIDIPTATLKLRARLANPIVANDIRNFTPGMFVRVRIPSSAPYEALLVNDRAVLYDQGDRIVYTVDAENRVHRRPVELGTLHGRLRVITSGLNRDEHVVVNGLQRVRDGAIVDPQPGVMPGAPTPSSVSTSSSTPATPSSTPPSSP